MNFFQESVKKTVAAIRHPGISKLLNFAARLWGSLVQVQGRFAVQAQQVPEGGNS
jgi:hypothetical protein